MRGKVSLGLGAFLADFRSRYKEGLSIDEENGHMDIGGNELCSEKWGEMSKINEADKFSNTNQCKMCSISVSDMRWYKAHIENMLADAKV